MCPHFAKKNLDLLERKHSGSDKQHQKNIGLVISYSNNVTYKMLLRSNSWMNILLSNILDKPKTVTLVDVI